MKSYLVEYEVLSPTIEKCIVHANSEKEAIDEILNKHNVTDIINIKRLGVSVGVHKNDRL